MVFKQFYKRAIILVLILSFFLHMIFLIKHPGTVFNQPEVFGLSEEISYWGSRDAWLYATMANQWIEHRIYGYDTHHTGEIVKNAFVTPGHPFYLIIIFMIANILQVEQLVLVKIVNMLLSMATVLLIYFISKRLFKNEWTSVMAALLYATYFSPLHYFRTALTEIPGIFFFCLTLFFFLIAIDSNRARDHLLFTISFCITVMIRPTPAPLILLAIATVLIQFGWRESVRIGSLWLVGPILIILPWTVRNYLSFGELYLFSSHGGNSIYAGANPFFIYDFSDYWNEREEMGFLREEQGAYGIYKIKEGFASNPALWFSWFTIGKTYELFKQVDATIHYNFYKGFSIFQFQHFLVVVIGFLSGVIHRKKREVRIIFVILITYIALSNFFLTIPRYGFYIVPMLCILAGYGIVTGLKAVLHRWRGRRTFRKKDN